MTRIRTLNFLPTIFQTPTNSQFLGATLDQIVNPPVTKKIEGYVGSKFGYGINARDYYVTEPTKTRTDYQLDPGIVFTKNNESTATDFISYPGILDAIKLAGGITGDNDRLFTEQFYSWDSFTNLDKIINFNQYYWLPEGAPAVTVATDTVFQSNDYIVEDQPNGYNIRSVGSGAGTINPTITLLRGGTYNFIVDQDTNFWIQTEPGTAGTSAIQSNISTRDVFGVQNNGADKGIVTFSVPAPNAQNEFLFPGNNTVDVVSNIPFSQLNGARLNDIENIDSITSLDGLTVMFFDTGIPDEIAYVSSFYSETPFDTNGSLVAPQTISVTGTTAVTNAVTCNSTANLVVGQSITFNGVGFGGINVYQTSGSAIVIYYVNSILSATLFTISTQPNNPATVVALSTASGSMTGNINQGLYEEGFYTPVNDYFFRITLIGDISDPIIQLTQDSLIPTNEKILPLYGSAFVNIPFYKNVNGIIQKIPLITAPLDTLYYQDGSASNKVGIIKIIESNFTNTLNVERDILGQENFSIASPNGITIDFTNGLKVQFDGDVIPTSYLQGEYYVEGVGTAIQLIPTTDLICPEPFTVDSFAPYDILPYDIGNYDSSLYIPVQKDYITIARNALNRNPWSRSNRWFHIQVIQATADYNNNPNILNEFAKAEYKALRPIIEFYPNLKMFQSGTYGLDPVDFFDFRTTDALTYVAGQQQYYPDIKLYTDYTATITGTNITPVSESSFSVGNTVIIATLGTTNWNNLAGTIGLTYIPGNRVYIKNAPAAGTGTAVVLSTSTTITINIADIYEGGHHGDIHNEDIVPGMFEVGQYISDLPSPYDSLGNPQSLRPVLPVNATITSITGVNTLTLTVSWDDPTIIQARTNSSLIANDDNNSNYLIPPNSRIIFAGDTNPEIKNKIFVANYSTITPGSDPVLTLTLAPDGVTEEGAQLVALRGYSETGVSHYYHDEHWEETQEKTDVNQPPLFDVFDNNGISLGNNENYFGTSFRGTKLFAYGLGEGPKDNILGFPLRYSQIDNVGDISFDVSFNSDKFTYVTEGQPIEENINIGYVYNYSSRTDYERLLGWQTAIAPSVQYQLFEFNYVAGTPTTFVCDVATLDTEDSAWPVIQVFQNNRLLQSGFDYAYNVTTNSTRVNVYLSAEVDTIIQILVLSNQVSQKAYYTIPINLSNNPFNTDITIANVGDIRGQYQSIFYNNPNTSGEVFGPNNFRDLGNIVPYGDKIIQNSASLVLPGAFLRKQEHSLFNSLLFNSREYIKFKTLLVDTVQNGDYEQRFDPSYLLDDALDVITSTKSKEQPFFWSDMVPNQAPFLTNVYTFASSLDQSIYPLSKVYDFSTANYDSVLVYIGRTIDGVFAQTQLIRNVDYIVGDTSPSLTITLDLEPGDKVTVKEYNQTYGSYVPNTPTKLGLYPAYIPQVILDPNYNQPTYFILGHDGSYTKLYGDYDPDFGVLIDFRDQVLLEFERRVYNNLKLSANIPIQEYEVLPGFFRETDYTFNEWLQIYTPNFLDWIGQNRLDYKRQIFRANDELTYNYNNSGNKINKAAIQQGYWRGLYQYYYDTTTPDTTPWQMLGYANQPDWWVGRYGPAPWTSDNLILWDDLANGYDYNNGNPRVIPSAIRPELLQVIPVNEAGDLLSPYASIMGNFNPNLFRRDWKVGDGAPVEFSYRRSSTYPFDLMKILALTRPAEFFNLAVDLDNYKYNEEFNQYLVNDRTHLKINEIEIYGNGIAKTSYINWIVDYEKQLGINATDNIKSLLSNMDVRLVYRVAGFTDKNLLKFYVEKGTPNSKNSSLLIPDESYAVLLYENQPYDRLVYSGVIVQITEHGYLVFGNSQTNAYFNTLKPLNNGALLETRVEDLSVKTLSTFSSVVEVVPYGTLFYSAQELAQFLSNYGAYLESRGAIFDSNENGIEVTWQQMIAEFLYWAQMGWEVGSVTTLNPAAKSLKIDKESQIVQPLTIKNTNFILNQNLYPIEINYLSVLRDSTKFEVSPLNQGDTIAYGQFNLSNFEHGIVFDNITLFDDVIYNLITGLRQLRILLRGTKSAEWNGTIFASGFIYNQDNILEWNKDTKYTKGEIVKYKNKYWTALRIVQPSVKFNEQDWLITDYNEIQKGLLPNSSTNSYESTLYYNVDVANLEKDADLLSFSLIGFRPRDYLALVDLTDITQVNVYKNMIRNKGTKNAVSAFKGANLPQGGIQYETYENWAVKSGEFGGILNNNFVEFRLRENLLTGNPAKVALTDGIHTPGMEQYVPLYSLFNYGRNITSPDVMPTINDEPSTLFPTAGYVNFNDVKMAAYYFNYLPIATNTAGLIVPLSNLYVGDYIWIADYLSSWRVYSPYSKGTINQIRNNLNGTVTVFFDSDHNLNQYDIFAIINFDPAFNGYYFVGEIINTRSVLVALDLSPSIKTLTGQGIALGFESMRVSNPADIPDLSLLSAEFRRCKIWVDENSDGGWAVYQKSLNYDYQEEFTKANSITFGSSVAFTEQAGYLIGDAEQGEVYRYQQNPILDTFDLTETLSGSTSFGSAINYSENIYVISQPTGTPEVYIKTINNTPLTDDFIDYQSAIAAPLGVTDWGSSVAYSSDTNWMYISAKDDNAVYVYRKQSIPLDAGYFNSGETYQITSLGILEDATDIVIGQTYEIVFVGSTDFTLLGAINNNVGTTFVATAEGTGSGKVYLNPTDFTAIGSDDNREGMYFVATGAGTGTGSATQVTYKLVNIIDASGFLAAGDDFGTSVSTNHYGDTVIIGAPNIDSGSKDKWGKAYVYSRAVQNFEVQTSSLPFQNQFFNLAWLPATVSRTATATNASGNIVTLSGSMTEIVVNMPVIFSGNDLLGTGISPNTVYYVRSKAGSNITLKLSRSSNTAVELMTASGLSVSSSFQLEDITVTKNGLPVLDNQYGVSNSTLVYVGSLNAGDIINVSGNKFTLLQTLTTEQTPRTGVQFGISNDTNTFANEILVGAPFAISSENQEGAVYRYTNGGASYGLVIGSEDVNVTAPRKLLINGYLVTIPAGDATAAANIINAQKITNITATAIDGKIAFSLTNSSIAQVNQKLILSSTDPDTFSELGITIYKQTQIITNPHKTGPSQFGTSLKLNEHGSFVVSAPVGTRYAATTFDFTDDENLDNDTVFDNNATQFIETDPNAGAVYMFDYIPVYNENINNVGVYVYAQSVNNDNIVYGSQPRYGTALEFNNNVVLIGTPGFRPEITDGQVISYVNATGIKDWSVFRQSSAIVDVNKIQNVQIFSAETNETLMNLDYIDPLQGKLLGAVQQNIDYISNVDPASYNNGLTSQRGLVWGTSNVGQIWFDTSRVRFLNYHQNDPVYNSNYWGSLFPYSDVAVYTWIASNTPPDLYTGPGTPGDVTLYSVQSTVDNTGALIPVYYFWVRDTNIVSREAGKALSDTVIARYISNPFTSGISYMAALLPNSIALYNCNLYFNANDSVFHIGFNSGNNDDLGHNEFSLIRADFADDFLPGLPGIGLTKVPESLYDRLLDSLSGVDESGGVVPDPYLPKAVQSGVLARPRQSFFYDRFEALKNYLTYANEIMALYPIREIRPNATYLYQKGIVNPSTVANPDWANGALLEYNTTDWWEFVNWWAPGYDNSTKAALQVPLYADLSALNVANSTIVTVASNGEGFSETYRYDGDGIWTRIGLQNGTIKFKLYLWDYAQGRLGFGDNFYDTNVYDDYPSDPTRWIVRALNEQIYTNDLLIFRNRSLILLFEYIQSETFESQNFLPWLNKTSLLDVTHKIRELLPYEVYQTDNQEFLEGYINEVKPYHVFVKEFLFEYTGEDVWTGDITDFDLPAKWNSQLEKFISPQLVYSNPSTDSEYLPFNPIWQDQQYAQWFSNYGISITGQEDVMLTTLESYMTLATNQILVNNSSGFPINGVIMIGDEMMSYNTVDRALNLLSGLVRGLNGTPVSTHLPGEQIFMDLPPILVLNGGRNYIEPPKVRAVIDLTKYPPPREEAQLEAVMSLDSVLQITVVNPGSGYAVLPDIVIDPAVTIGFTTDDVNQNNSTITLYAPTVSTGDLIKYKVGVGSTNIEGLKPDQWYYVNLLESSPTAVIGLYTSFDDAVKDQNRVQFYSVGTGTDHSINLGAKASAVSTSYPVRENNITLRFDRTTYTSQIRDWLADSFYGSFFAGTYTNSEDIASSGITLQNTQPPISSILASNQGYVMEIQAVENDRVVEWSSFVRVVDRTVAASDSIRLTPYDDGSGEPNSSGSTVGFYVDMPIKFVGATGTSGLTDGTTYYVSEVVNVTDFKVSATEGGPSISLNDYVLGALVLHCYTAKVTDTAILTVLYPGLLHVTQTNSGTNKFTVPKTLVGTGGTTGFYINMPVFFTGTTFGGVRENQVYYITTICDGETFTLSEDRDPDTLVLYSVDSTTDFVIVDSTVGITTNEPLIFNTFVISGLNVNAYAGIITDAGNFITGASYTITDVGTTDWNVVAGTIGEIYSLGDVVVVVDPGSGDGSAQLIDYFGNIKAGEVYYVREVVNNTTLILSTVINGDAFDPGTVSPAGNTSGLVTSQENVLQLTTATGSMTLEVDFPVSPGQINGQLFGLYNTSEQFPNITGSNLSLLISGVVTSTRDTVDIMTLSEEAGGTVNMYVNMPFRLDSAVGGLTTGTTYYVANIGTVEFEASSTSSSGNTVTVDTTDSLYIGMPVIFSGAGIGGIIIGDQYFIETIDSINNHITLSISLGGSTYTLTTDNGLMTGTGEPYIQVSATSGGAVITLTDDPSGSTSGPLDIGFNQYIAPVDYPEFSVSYILGGYRVIIQDGGMGFAVDNEIVIPGASVGGTNPKNNITLVVDEVDEDGVIQKLIVLGTVPSISNNYYLKVVSVNKLAVFSDSLMTVPVSGIDFAYTGYTTTSVTAITSDDNSLTVTSTDGLEVNDAVVFSGDIFELVGVPILTAYQTYYIISVNTSTNKIIVSTEPGGTAVNMPTSIAVDFTVTKGGSYTFLPEPFYFNQSVVKYNNKVYRCVISNNDKEFIFGKWEELNSGDRILNALDRVIGYYQPTINMPGVDLPQLFAGVEYPNATYLGNKFQPNEQFGIDTVLNDLPFYPVDINITGILYNGLNYVAAANLPRYSAILTDPEGSNWSIAKLTNAMIGLTDVLYADNLYVMTSTNTATPIFRSNDGVTWTTNGYYTPFDKVPFDDTNYDMTAISIAALSLQSITYGNGIFVAVGDQITYSEDTYIWREGFVFTDGLQNRLYGVAYVDIPTYTGFIAVGKGERFDYSTGVTTTVPCNLVLTSTDGKNWTQTPWATTKGFYGVTSDSSYIYAVGEDGVIYLSQNGVSWFGVNETQVISTNSFSDAIVVNNTTGLTVDDLVRSTENFDTVIAGTDYYVAEILSSTQLRLSPDSTTTNAGSFVNGQVYLITSLGSTNWNSIGYVGTPVVGGTFTASDVGSGTGVARRLVDLTTSGGVSTVTFLHLPYTSSLIDVIYENNLFVAVGDDGLIKTSSDGLIWTTQISNTLENLNAINYASTSDTWTAVGDNNTILQSTDNAVTWTNQAVFVANPAAYNVVGDPFSTGYGPEELVPGVVQDSLAMIVNTRPGTNWEYTEYGHVGYYVMSHELNADVTNIYSFQSGAHIPSSIAVFIIDGTTGLSTSLYMPNDYTVNWMSQTISLTVPLDIVADPLVKVRIDVYEVGNGDQLVKASTFNNPIIENNDTGFTEFNLNANYSDQIYNGSGVVRPGTTPVTVNAIETIAATNSIVIDDVDSFLVNYPIEFQGSVFGGVAIDTTYYVKSISYVTSSITISDTYIPSTGVAGAVFNLSDATGTMQIVIQAGGSYVWTEPVVYANGNKLVFGTTNQISQTKAVSNTVVTNSTSGIIVDTPVIFDSTMFGPDILPLTTYYVKQIVDGNEFTISDTVGGTEKVLTTQFGTATYITNDYAIGLANNGITAKIIFANQWDDQDYIAFTIFGEGIPFTYGYTLPQTQIIGSDGSATYDLDNAIDSINAYNAIVEVDGIRQIETVDYTIDHITDQITFSTIPAAGNTIAVTSFNDTGRQYFSTEYNITGQTVSAISGIQNELTAPLVVAATTTTTGTNIVTLTSTVGVFIGQPIQFKGTAFGSVSVDGTVYWVKTVPNGTQITLSPDSDLISTVPLTNGTGLMIGYVGGLEAIRVTLVTPYAFPDPVNNNIKVRIDGTLGSTQLNNNSYYVHVIDYYTFDLYEEPYNPAYAATNYPVTTITSYTSGGYAWNAGSYYVYTTTGSSTSAGNNINVVDADNLVPDTPVYFVESGVVLGNVTTIPEIVAGQKYYIKEVDTIANTFKISESYKGSTKTLTSGLSGFTVYVSQWEQENVDRLWVTVNGYRVPSSKLKLNAASEVSILTPISITDSVTITSMIPTATPSQEVYVNIVSIDGDPSVYRINTFAQTWLTKTLYDIQNEIFVHDVTKLTNTVTQTATLQAPIDGFYNVGLIADKNEILRVTVYNVTTASEINYDYINIVLINSAPVVQIEANPAFVNTGDEVVITTLTGKNIWINGELIRITKIDADNNIITGFQRGANGTSIQTIIPVNTPVIGLLEDNRLPDTFYNKTWNSDNYNTTLGDPLQISDTPAAVFLRTDIT